MGVAADVAGAARAGADVVQRVFHRLDDRGVLAHAEIVVRAPHGDRLGAVVAGEAARVGERALGPQDVDEHAVAALVVKAVDRGPEDAVVIQLSEASLALRRAFTAATGAIAIANDSQLVRACGRRRDRSGRAPVEQRAVGGGAGEHRDSRRTAASGHGWPRVRWAMRRAMPAAAVDQRDAGEGAAQLLVEQREMGAGEDDDVDVLAALRLEHRQGRGAHRLEADRSRRPAWPRPARPARASRGGSPCNRRRSARRGRRHRAGGPSPAVPSTPITRVFDSSAAGLIAGTVPTIGKSSAARAWSRAMVEAVLQAMTTSRGRECSTSRPSRAGTRSAMLRLAALAIGKAGAVGEHRRSARWAAARASAPAPTARRLRNRRTGAGRRGSSHRVIPMTRSAGAIQLELSSGLLACSQ